VFSNDPADSVIRIVIAADVRPEPYTDFSVEVLPAVAEFSSDVAKRASHAEINIKSTVSQNLGIEIVDMPSDFIEGKLSAEVLRPSEEVKLKVELKGKSENAGLSKSITLQLNDPDSSRFTIPVRK